MMEMIPTSSALEALTMFILPEDLEDAKTATIWIPRLTIYSRFAFSSALTTTNLHPSIYYRSSFQ
jgi:hypothetical protein